MFKPQNSAEAIGIVWMKENDVFQKTQRCDIPLSNKNPPKDLDKSLTIAFMQTFTATGKCVKELHWGTFVEQTMEGL